MTAALSPVARALLAWLQERPAAGEGSLKTWGQTRRPQLTLTQVEVRAAELVDAGLVTREVKADGRAIYRAATLAPRVEPAPVEVVTEPSPTPPPASEAKPKKAAKNPVPQKVICGGCGKLDVCNGDPSCPSCADYMLRSARETGAKLAAVVVDREEEIARLAEALLSWERLWGVNGTNLTAMEARIEEAETRLAQVTAERDQLAARAPAEPTPPEPPTSLSPNAQGALAILSTTRGTSPHEIATRSRILRRSVPHALAELRAAGLAYESTPGLWRRR
jgi:enoyl-CoA hydratase/carnithine racemase